jgi:ribonuclease P protein component
MAGPAPAGKRFSLSQKQRLERSWEFDRVRREGQRVVKGCLILNWRTGEMVPDVSRVGVVTSRKIGGAVIRSRARRLLREVFRRHQNDFVQPVEMVLVARQSISEKGLADVERDFMTAARQGRLLREMP